jgi:hypothetical protein
MSQTYNIVVFGGDHCGPEVRIPPPNCLIKSFTNCVTRFAKKLSRHDPTFHPSTQSDNHRFFRQSKRDARMLDTSTFKNIFSEEYVGPQSARITPLTPPVLHRRNWRAPHFTSPQRRQICSRRPSRCHWWTEMGNRKSSP